MVNKTEIEQDLGQIANMLILNGTLTECPGLVHGKIGIAVFFFHYTQYTDNELFADYSMDLIGEMLNQIHVNSSADYEKGIAGIGVGIDYMIRNNFLVTEEDICEDFDERMFRAVLYDPWLDLSLYNGLTGYGRYWMTRLRYPEPAKQAQRCLMHIVTQIQDNLIDIPVEEQTDVYCFLHDLHKLPGFDTSVKLLEQCREQFAENSRSFSRLGNSSTGHILRMYQRCRYFNEDLQGEINLALKQMPELDREKPPVNMGLLTGYAGEGLLRLTVQDTANGGWMQLF
ncbi:hypothetical protein LJC57_06015 [Parabacteroides sp. OttesenSCG-928-G07]|nr:hypothetical protein [Parabacteroides sp. OttesenSCG-928-G21]MDL2278130.1 hypothetical protein [Parabacteroides sp. OttesenSCG-928-G07]